MANCGFPLTRTMVKAFAWSIAKKSGGLCSNSGTFNWHFFVSGLTVIVATMMVQSAQYVDVTNLKDLKMRLSSG